MGIEKYRNISHKRKPKSEFRMNTISHRLNGGEVGKGVYN